MKHQILVLVSIGAIAALLCASTTSAAQTGATAPAVGGTPPPQTPAGQVQGGRARGQGPANPGAGGRGATPSARATAPVDITGYWVGLITDDWRYRMLTPPKGNVDYLPVTPAARDAANQWDAAKDAAAGEACKGYGALGVMRLPGRLSISWEGDNVLKVDTEAGTQTRRLNFNVSPSSTPPTADQGYQGYSVAAWTGGGRRGASPAAGDQSGLGAELLVTTTHMKPGYMRKNGVPYGANAVLTENWVRLVDGNTQYLAITQKLEDPVYLTQPFIKTVMFLKEPDGKRFAPTSCVAQ